MTSFAEHGAGGLPSARVPWAADEFGGAGSGNGARRIDLLIVAVTFLFVTAVGYLVSTAVQQVVLGEGRQDAGLTLGIASLLILLLCLAGTVGLFAWLRRCWHGPIEGLPSLAGRISRRVLLLRWVVPRLLLGMMLGLVVVAVAAAAGTDVLRTALILAWPPLLLLELLLLWPNLSVLGRRLHDIGGSAWWLLLLAVPFANLGLVLVLLFRGGQPTANRFGPMPI